VTTGIHQNVPPEIYHGWPAYGSSDLKAMREGPPAMVPFRRSQASNATGAMALGTACHMAVLEPARFETTYVFKPEDMSFATKEGKAWKALHAEREILTHLQAESARGIVAAFQSKAEAVRSLRGAEIEVSVLWQDPCGVMLKGRPDWIKDGITYDLKISRFAQERSIPFRAWADGWMHQAAHYRTGLELLGEKIAACRLVVVNPKPPHSVYLIELKRNDLDYLALENAAAVRRIADCERTGVWPGTPDEWESIDLPPTASAAMLDMLDLDAENA